jgi:hypothetical protein
MSGGRAAALLDFGLLMSAVVTGRNSHNSSTWCCCCSSGGDGAQPRNRTMTVGLQSRCSSLELTGREQGCRSLPGSHPLRRRHPTIPSGRSDIPALLALPLVAFALGILVGGGKSGSARRHALSAPGLGKRPRHTAAHEKGAHPLEVWQIECLVVEGLGRAVKAHGRQRPPSVLAPAGTARHQVFPEKDCESSRELRPLRIR